MFVLYNSLVGCWVTGIRNGVTYVSTDRQEAVCFASESIAKSKLKKVDPAWQPYTKVMEYTKSTQMYDKDFVRGA